MKLYPTFRGWWIVAVSFFGLYLHGSATSYLFALLVVLIVPAMATGPLIAAFSFDLLGSYTEVFVAFAIASYVGGAFFYLAKPPRKGTALA
ncbi:MAG: hypothetical protein V3S98_01120 [Dehalococcoidia bacterium]